MGFRDISFEQTDRQRALQNQGIQQIQAGIQGFARQAETKRQRALAGKKAEADLEFKKGVRKEDVEFRERRLDEEIKAREAKKEGARKGILSKKLDTERKEKAAIEREERGVVRGLEKEDRMFKRGAQKELTQRRIKFQRDTRGLDRVFGNVTALKAKFIKDPASFTAADQFQLIRSIVPLSEINPGVVREQEFQTSKDLGGKITGAKTFLANVPKGTLLDPSVIEDLFNSAKVLEDSKNLNEEGRFSDISDEIEALGLDDKAKELVLGTIGRSAMERLLARRAEESKPPAGNLVGQRAQQPSAISNVLSSIGLGGNEAVAATPQSGFDQSQRQQRILQLRQKNAGVQQ